MFLIQDFDLVISRIVDDALMNWEHKQWWIKRWH